MKPSRNQYKVSEIDRDSSTQNVVIVRNNETTRNQYCRGEKMLFYFTLLALALNVTIVNSQLPTNRETTILPTVITTQQLNQQSTTTRSLVSEQTSHESQEETRMTTVNPAKENSNSTIKVSQSTTQTTISSITRINDGNETSTPSITNGTFTSTTLASSVDSFQATANSTDVPLESTDSYVNETIITTSNSIILNNTDIMIIDNITSGIDNSSSNGNTTRFSIPNNDWTTETMINYSNFSNENSTNGNWSWESSTGNAQNNTVGTVTTPSIEISTTTGKRSDGNGLRLPAIFRKKGTEDPNYLLLVTVPAAVVIFFLICLCLCCTRNQGCLCKLCSGNGFKQV